MERDHEQATSSTRSRPLSTMSSGIASGPSAFNAKDMTFKGPDHENRTLMSVERMTTLLKSIQNGRYR
jgi:hypothetical protein